MRIQLSARILVMYMMVMLVAPCHDTCDADSHVKLTSVSVVQNHHESVDDICSPFCSCACCATAIQGLHFVKLNVSRQFSLHDFVLLNPVFYSLESTSIWQPPKSC